MKRVMIVGQPGSGKSTLARQLGAATGLPVFHIDHIHWQAGWVQRQAEYKTRLCLAVHARPSWIFEGGHSVTWPDRLSRCDTIIWLDLPVRIRLRRVIVRSIRHYGRVRADLPDGCPEQIDPAFYRWIWNTRTSGRDSIARLVAHAPAGKIVHHLTTPRQIRAFVASLQRPHA